MSPLFTIAMVFSTMDRGRVLHIVKRCWHILSMMLVKSLYMLLRHHSCRGPFHPVNTFSLSSTVIPVHGFIFITIKLMKEVGSFSEALVKIANHMRMCTQMDRHDLRSDGLKCQSLPFCIVATAKWLCLSLQCAGVAQLRINFDLTSISQTVAQEKLTVICSTLTMDFLCLVSVQKIQSMFAFCRCLRSLLTQFQ